MKNHDEMYQLIAAEEGVSLSVVEVLAFPIVHGMHRQLTEEQMWESVRLNIKMCKAHIVEEK